MNATIIHFPEKNTPIETKYKIVGFVNGMYNESQWNDNYHLLMDYIPHIKQKYPRCIFWIERSPPWTEPFLQEDNS